VLPEDERHYLVHVCRARPGDRATATDGRGKVATLRLLDASRGARVEVESLGERPRAGVCWVLAGAVEGGRADWMVEKLGELGVAVFQPVDAMRSRWPASAARRDRLARMAVAALRQSQRAHLLEVHAPMPLDRAVDALPKQADRWLCSAVGVAAAPGAKPLGPERITVGAIGPAEGFEPHEETSLIGRGFRVMMLADGRLRTETAAVAWASWWAAGVAAGGVPKGP
jgi:16S rRNA (uracil1498-N3)-methyltransferase